MVTDYFDRMAFVNLPLQILDNYIDNFIDNYRDWRNLH